MISVVRTLLIVFGCFDVVLLMALSDVDEFVRQRDGVLLASGGSSVFDRPPMPQRSVRLEDMNLAKRVGDKKNQKSRLAAQIHCYFSPVSCGVASRG